MNSTLIGTTPVHTDVETVYCQSGFRPSVIHVILSQSKASLTGPQHLAVGREINFDTTS